MSEKVEWFSTGSIPLNLAFSQKGIDGGVPRGRITNIVGDGSSGKTIITLETCFRAWMDSPKSKIFPETKKITIHYNNPEEVMDFDLNAMYGDKFKSSIIWKNIPVVEAWGRDVAKVLKNKGKDEGIIYVLDSLDAVKAKKIFEKFNKDANKEINIDIGSGGGGKEKKEKGSYDLEKQKYLTREFFPNICELMGDVDFTLIIISQTKDKIGTLFPEKTRSGGSALNFYTHLVPWFSESSIIKKVVEGQNFTKGIISKCRVKRSKVGKSYRESETVIIYDYGVDNIGSCLNYLIGDSNSYTVDKITEEIGIDSSLLPEKKINRSNLLKIIEDNDLEEMLSNKVEEVWLRREDKLDDNRKPKFAKKLNKLPKTEAKPKDEDKRTKLKKTKK